MTTSTLVADSAGAASVIAILGTLGGVLLAGIMALITAILNHKWQQASETQQRRAERQDALRNEKLEAYGKYLAAGDRMVAELLAEGADVMRVFLSTMPVIESARSQVLLLAGEEVYAAVMAEQQEEEQNLMRVLLQTSSSQDNPQAEVSKAVEDSSQLRRSVLAAMRRELS